MISSFVSLFLLRVSIETPVVVVVVVV